MIPGLEERAARGPIRRKGWLDPRRRALGGRAFALHRLTGLLLVAYLYLHLGVLTLLLRGASAWDDFVDIASMAVFLGFDVVLIFIVLFHALNGIRVALIGNGVLADRQRALFWAATATGAAALAYAAIHVVGSM